MKQIPIDDLDGYLISGCGDVWCNNRKYWVKSKILNGYRVIQLKYKTYHIHRLVAMAYISNDVCDLVVNHIDGNKLNNTIDNLEWVTQKENVNKSTKLTSHPKRVIHKDINGTIIQTFESARDASRELGISYHKLLRSCHDSTENRFIFEQPQDSHDVDMTRAIQITDFPNYYLLPNGSIYSSKRKKCLKPVINDNGQAYVTLLSNGMKKNCYIKKLMKDHGI